MHMTRRYLLQRLTAAAVFGWGWGIATMNPASAQVGPTAAQASAYTGLHAAAHKGDVAKIDRLASAKADLNARDSNGRTPLHVATFARQRDAIRALVKAGANINLLDNDRYDGITIASVADDEETLRVLDRKSVV